MLDGELVVPLAGAFSFDALQQRIHPAASRVNMLAKTTPAWYLVFDLLSEDGPDLIELPLSERRARLEKFARAFDGTTLRLSPATRDRKVVDDWFARVGGALDGVIAKRADMAYASGTRDGAVKVKRSRTADCVIGGFRYAKGSTTQVGSLLLGLYDDDGLLDYIGFCSAFPAEEKKALIERLRPHVGEPGFTGGAPDTAPSRWDRDPDRDKSYVKLKHDLVLEVAFDQVTSGRIRHGTKPVRWRIDKAPRQCTARAARHAGPSARAAGLRRGALGGERRDDDHRQLDGEVDLDLAVEAADAKAERRYAGLVVLVAAVGAEVARLHGPDSTSAECPLGGIVGRRPGR